MVGFADGVTEARQDEILAAGSLARVRIEGAFVLAARTTSQHIQVLVEALHAAFPDEVLPGYAFLDRGCAAAE
jgi:hypothetical protein